MPETIKKKNRKIKKEQNEIYKTGKHMLKGKIKNENSFIIGSTTEKMRQKKTSLNLINETI